ncbi:MAG: lipopolysaccharide heptosyltransferase II [Candidatus Edwardsbacteria bacterium]|nr:lipopolysaccharide heptosyltransferase II [Candidatus Edwardsbacteria bacterium]
MNRILVIRLGAIGDIVLATAVFSALAKHHPEAKIDFICKERFAGLLENDPRIHRIIRLDELGRHKELRGLLLFLHGLQPERYDCIIDLQGNARSRFMAVSIKAGKKILWTKDALRRRMLVYGIGSAKQAPGVIERYLKTLVALGIDAAGARPKLYPKADPGVKLPDRPFIAVAPGAHWPTKRWPAERYAELIAKIGHGKWDIALVGDAGDRGIAAEIAARVPFPIHDLCGCLTLPQLVYALSRSALLATNDTGAMHVAEAAGVPVIALFGPTVKGFGFAPWRSESAVIERDLKCRPCALHGSKTCPKKHFNCMNGITAEEVHRAIRPMLLKHLSLLLFS